MKQQQRMAIMKDLIKKIRSKGRMDAQNRWWVAELLAKDCEKAWTRAGWEDTMQKWYGWLENMKRKDEKENMEEMHQRKVEKMIKSAEGSAGLLHKITKPTMWRGGVQILKEEEKDARLLHRCEAEKKNGQSTGIVIRKYRICKASRGENDELKACEEALPRLKEGDLDKASRLYKAKTWSQDVTAFHPKNPLDLTKQTRG